MDILKDIISDIRSVRIRMNVSPSKYSDLVVQCKKEDQTFINDYSFILKPLEAFKHYNGRKIKKACTFSYSNFK